jgi:predicted AAA+ superfamily ATPase
MNTLWLRGGFPESLLASSDKQSLSWRKDFIRTYLERDAPLFGARIPSETLGRFWNMLAHQQGGLFNASTLARSLDVSSVTISRYLDQLVDLLLVRRLQPWTLNVGKRLVKSPKIYIRDSGIVHALLNIPEINYLFGHPVVGGSWEGFVIENILSVLPGFARPYFYRTSAGAEIDLVIEFADRARWAIEIKKDAVPHVSKGFHLACADIDATRKFIVHGGQDSFTVPDQIHAVTVNKMLEHILSLAK